MRIIALNAKLHAGSVGAHDTVIEREDAQILVCCIVYTDNAVNIVKDVCLQQLPCAGSDFLSFLKNNFDRPPDFFLQVFQHLCRAKHKGGMSIMTTRMHHAGVLGGKVHPRRLGDGQRVYVPAQGNGLAARVALYRGDNIAHTRRLVGNVPFVKMLLYECRRLKFLA